MHSGAQPAEGRSAALGAHSQTSSSPKTRTDRSRHCCGCPASTGWRNSEGGRREWEADQANQAAPRCEGTTLACALPHNELYPFQQLLAFLRLSLSVLSPVVIASSPKHPEVPLGIGCQAPGRVLVLDKTTTFQKELSESLKLSKFLQHCWRGESIPILPFQYCDNGFIEK
jgi:hypothetical protein